MSFSAKDVINEAFDRTGIWPNPADSLPGEMFDTGLKVLQGLINTYNIRNYITCSQRSVELVVPADGIIHLGKSEEGVTPVIDNVTNINNVFVKSTTGECDDLKYVSFMEYPRYSHLSYVYTHNQVGEYAYDLMFNKWMIGKTCIITYNAPFECQRDTMWYLPPEYHELFVLGLCVKLLAIFPREDKGMLEAMGSELSNITGAIEAKQSSAKILTWNRYSKPSMMERFNSGSFLGV